MSINDNTCTRHTWAPADGDLIACRDCTATTNPCHTCKRPLETANLICHACLTRSRRTLVDIQEAANTPYAYPTLGLKAIRYDGERTSGTRVDDPRGSTPATDLDLELIDLAPGGGVDVLAILRDPPNVLEPLLDWADRWAEARSENSHGMNMFDYLDSRMLWAANTPRTSAWADYVEEARTIRTRLRRLVGLAPDHHPTPCVHCGGSIIQEQADRGLEDKLRCTGCHMEWRNREHLARVERTHAILAPDEKPETLVTLEEARAALPMVRRQTINVALHRDRKRPEGERRVPERGKNRRGETLYRLGDLAEIIATARASTSVPSSVG